MIWPKRTRMLWLVGIVTMHIAIGLSMGLLLFSLIMIVLNVAAFGPESWTMFERSWPLPGAAAAEPRPSAAA